MKNLLQKIKCLFGYHSDWVVKGVVGITVYDKDTDQITGYDVYENIHCCVCGRIIEKELIGKNMSHNDYMKRYLK